MPSRTSHDPAPELKKHARSVVRKLKQLYPVAECALLHEDAWQLLSATILSAQCTDERVNMVTPKLFATYPNAEAMAKAKQTDVESIIHSTGFFRQKAKSLIAAAKGITEEFGGEVPQAMEALLTLRGVARKTANVVLGTAFGLNEGVVVDTHVKRLSFRLGLTEQKDPVKVEKDLMSIIPRKDWTVLSHMMIWHGRKVCDARKPDCDACTLSRICPQKGVK